MIGRQAILLNLMTAAAADLFTADIKNSFYTASRNRPRGNDRILLLPAEAKLFLQIKPFKNYSYEDGLKHGSGTKWCYCYTGTGSHWELYHYL